MTRSVRMLSCVLLVLCCFAAASISSPVTPRDVIEDGRLSVPELLDKYGYPSETHKVQTDDGYVLTMYRIPYGKKCGPEMKRKPPLLLQHGLLCSSIDWLIMGPDKGLGYILADSCYDVWLGNNRGNTESKEHVSLDVHSGAYWDFSWHEMGVYDLPAMIDLVIHKTGQPSIHYVGHSQGTTQFFVFASQRPEYAAKIRSMHALAPVAFMSNLQSPLVQILSMFNAPISWITEVIGLHEFLPNTGFIADVGGTLCVDQYPQLQLLCSNVLFILCGYDSEQLNSTMLPAITGHTPAGAATKQLLHYTQEVSSGHFRMYDYGLLGNLARYGKGSPPDYDLSNVTIPIALHFSDNDWMSARKDVDKLATALKSVIGKFRVPLDKFNHLDYMWAIDGKALLYDQMINILDRY